MQSLVTDSPHLHVSEIMFYLDMFGVAVFALTGALLVEHRHINLLGVLVSGVLTAVGGGTLRDILLGQTPVFWIQNPVYLLVAALEGLGVFFISPYYRFQTRDFLLADAVGLAVFTVIGIEKAIAIDVPLVNAVILGTVTGVGGGVIRDVVLGRGLPLLFQQELYATAAFLGGIVYILLELISAPNTITIFSSILSVFCIRLFALRWRLKLPFLKMQDLNRQISTFQPYQVKSKRQNNSN